MAVIGGLCFACLISSVRESIFSKLYLKKLKQYTENEHSSLPSTIGGHNVLNFEGLIGRFIDTDKETFYF
jgi:hypothetical protein